MNGGQGTQRPQRWREAHPDAFAELKRTYRVIGHSTVLMVLSLSLMGTALTISSLHLPGLLQPVVRMPVSLAAVCCAVVGLWRAVRGLWRALRAVVRTWLQDTTARDAN